MKSFKTILLAGALTSAMSLASSAAETMKNGTVMMMMPNGQTSSMDMTDPTMMHEMSTMMMKHGKKVSQTMIMMMMGGEMYMMPDMKMSNGKMMSDNMHPM